MNNHKEESNGGLVTCVRLSRETRNRLANLGSKDQTFDDIVNVIIDENLQEKPDSEDKLAQKTSDESEEVFS